MSTEKKTLTKAMEKKMSELPTTSARIRYLHSEGFTRSQIATILGKRYQHVRNVLITPLKNQN